jgi:hypothetical protein
VTTERRRHERYRLLGQVNVRRGATEYLLELGNLSLSGAFLSLGTLSRPPWLQLKRELDVALINPETLDPVDIRGRIVRIVEDEAGWSFAVEFIALDAAARQGVLRLVVLAAKQSGGPPPLPGQ